MTLTSTQLDSIGMLAALALAPVVVSWFIAVVPTKRKQATGLAIGNPLHSAPLAPQQSIVSKPLISMSRQMASRDMGGFLLGLRHLPVEQAAPLLTRYVRCSDPALQLYAQSILAQGREDLQLRLVNLQRGDETDPRIAAWMLETGLTLAAPTLTGAAERPGLIHHLADLASARLKTCAPTPSLLANAADVFLLAGRPKEAAALIDKLPAGSPLRKARERAVAHALQQQRLA